MFFFNQRVCVVILSASTKLQPPGSQQVPVLPSCHSRPHRMTGDSLRPRFVSLVVSSAKLTNTLSFLLLSHCSIPCAPCASRSRGAKPQTNQNQPNRKTSPTQQSCALESSKLASSSLLFPRFYLFLNKFIFQNKKRISSLY